MAQPAEVLDLFFAPDVLAVSTAAGNLTTQTVAAKSRPRVRLGMVDGNLPDRLLGAAGAPGRDSASPFGVGGNIPPRMVLGEED